MAHLIHILLGSLAGGVLGQVALEGIRPGTLCTAGHAQIRLGRGVAALHMALKVMAASKRPRASAFGTDFGAGKGFQSLVDGAVRAQVEWPREGLVADIALVSGAAIGVILRDNAGRFL